MRRIGLIACAVLGLALCSSHADASWSALTYSGYQPCWNIFAKRYKCLTCEEERLQKFWHDYYDALKNYYCALDHIDWVAYYKNHGYQINGCCGGGPGGGGGGGCCGRINYAPVFVVPGMQWAVPNSCTSGPPVGPGCAPGCAPGGYGPGPMAGPGPGPGYGPAPMGGPAPGGY
jgi:hypothetical protein